MPEYLLIGWEEIHQMFKTEGGKYLFSLSTLKKKLGPEMKRLGIVFEYTWGRCRRKVICGWPSVVRGYFMLLQQQHCARD